MGVRRRDQPVSVVLPGLDADVVWCGATTGSPARQALSSTRPRYSTPSGWISAACQEGTDTTTAQGKPVFTITAGLAEFESALIGERVTAGMARARAQGKHVGRPPIDPNTIEQMQEFSRQGRSYSDIQKACRGVGRSTVVKHTRGIRRTPRSRRSGATN